MQAFIRTQEGYIIKAYRDGDDWRVPVNQNDAYYYSVWSSDVKGSLFRALEETCRRVGGSCSASDVVFV